MVCCIKNMLPPDTEKRFLTLQRLRYMSLNTSQHQNCSWTELLGDEGQLLTGGWPFSEAGFLSVFSLSLTYTSTSSRLLIHFILPKNTNLSRLF